MSVSPLATSSLVLFVLLALYVSFLFGEYRGRTEEEVTRRAAGESAEQQAKRIISSAITDAEVIRTEATRLGEVEIERLRADVIANASGRLNDLNARELRVRERESAAERRQESLTGRERAFDLREAELNRRAPDRPLGPLTMRKLVERMMPSWHSPNNLAEIAFELSLRPTERAEELLEVVRVRLQSLGMTLPITFGDRHSELRTNSRTGDLKREIALLGDRVQSLERQNDEAEHVNRTLNQKLNRLRQELAALRQRERSPLDDYFIRVGAPKDLLEWARKFWRNRLHPDGSTTGMADLTRRYQEMDHAFALAISSAESIR